MSNIKGFLQDSMDMLDYIMTRSNVMPRLNARILVPSENYLDFSKFMCESFWHLFFL